MKKKAITLMAFCLTLISACGKSNPAASETDEYNRAMSFAEENNATTNVVASDVEDQGSGDSGAAATASSDEARKAKMKANDQKFMEYFKTLSQEEKKALVKTLGKIKKKLAKMSQEERAAFLKTLEKPLPSMKVIDKLLNAKKSQGGTPAEAQ